MRPRTCLHPSQRRCTYLLFRDTTAAHSLAVTGISRNTYTHSPAIIFDSDIMGAQECHVASPRRWAKHVSSKGVLFFVSKIQRTEHPTTKSRRSRGYLGDLRREGLGI